MYGEIEFVCQLSQIVNLIVSETGRQLVVLRLVNHYGYVRARNRHDDVLM